MTAKKQTKREKILAEREAVVPWGVFVRLIKLYSLKFSRRSGRPPGSLATMRQIHLLRHWYSPSDPGIEEALIELATVRLFQAAI